MLFLSDTGLFTTLMFENKTFTENTLYQKILNDKTAESLGYLYENIVAQMLTASGHKLFYHTFPNRSGSKNYAIDFLIARHNKVCPIEVKSGKDYKVHSALDNFMKTPDYNVKNAVVLHSGQKVYQENDITYLPIYYVMFLTGDSSNSADMVIPEIELPKLR